MAGWISSKLKVAETFLQQIDQQAAESLGKNERPQLDDAPVRSPLERAESIPLKDQLKKKSADRNEAHGNLRPEPNLEWQRKKSVATEKPNSSTAEKTNLVVSSAAATAADSDWTELLGSPDTISPVGSRPQREQKKRGILVSSPRMVEKKAGARSNFSVDRNRGLNASDRDRKRKDEDLGLPGSSDLPDSVARKPVTESRVSDGSVVAESRADANGHEATLGTLENGVQSDLGKSSRGEDGPVPVTLLGVVDGDNSKAGVLGNSIVKGDGVEVSVGHSVPKDLPGSSSGSDERSDSDSDLGSSSDSDSEIKRREERRKRREQILAEEAAAKAIEAIKEWENNVARLEGEKQSLEKILEERERQQAQEASELQISMEEIMEAVELEKQKHNSTRMEALTRLAKLETTNAELARLLATTQRNLEVEVDRVVELKRKTESKEAANEEIKRRISNIQESASSLSEKRSSKGVEFEREILQAEYSVVCDKVGQLQEKAKKLEENIETMRKEIEEPTEVEIELKKRLGQMTDHLIQKQAQCICLTSHQFDLWPAQMYGTSSDPFLFFKQITIVFLSYKMRWLDAADIGYVYHTRENMVIAGKTTLIAGKTKFIILIQAHMINILFFAVEALASEKATLLFRLEAVSRLLDESKSSPQFGDLAGPLDLESGTWSSANTRQKPLLQDRFRSGGQHLGSILRQLDAVFSAGAVFLRRNPAAQMWALVYLVCLHLWVFYIFMSHSQASDEARSGAVISLESINNTSGI